ncbi:Concanavalin A-like lectin/glucanase [Gracilaria domingensis]|nr:Concanavalin A-like lectin/glucanase [Gracilaria domingensis]
MHSNVSDRPFDVTVVNVKNLPAFRSLMDIQLADGTISRASSMENIHEERLRYDPTIASVSDAAYAATLNDQDGSLPHTAPYRANALSSNPTEFAYSVRARLSSPVLGFNPKECHDGIHLLDTNHCAVRVQERGLYKSVRGVLPIRQAPHKVYYEFFILRQSSGGGVCVGLSTHELPLNCLCGTRPNSIGFSTSGSLIQTVDGKETWRDFGDGLESGCTIGCLVSMKTAQNGNGNGKRSRLVSTEFFVDGKSRGTVQYQFVGDLEVFPTLSLFFKHARVYARFNGQDMLFTSSLPIGEEILTLDGQKIRRDAGNTPRNMGLNANG